ncbi:MAG TPA: RsmE family RNA methyltransferase [Verrucomicrobiae bacterium]|nr:RsmE family RNA methyltransferase [Verrucomicrobiae bacterium]
MPRFHLPPEQCREPLLTLAGREAQHALRVLRLRRGDAAIVLDGAGREFSCEVADTGRDQLKLAVKSQRTQPRPPCQLTLLQALPKGKLFNSIVEKATELGAARIIPLLTERVVVQLDDARAESRREHWQQMAVEAIKQCGALWLPRVEAAVTPAGFLSRGERFEMPLIASLQPGSRHPREYFDEFRKRHGRQPASACVWVGPEGDFTPEEVQAVTKSGASPITLGPLVLRADTAAVYCLSVLSYELQQPSA